MMEAWTARAGVPAKSIKCCQTALLLLHFSRLCFDPPLAFYSKLPCIFRLTTARRFFFDGQAILETQTPEQLGMEDDDLVDAFLQQVGG